MTGYLSDVAIIGAGLGGCALALALSERGIKVTVFESRPLNAEVFYSGVILTPNGVSILDRLGILPRIQDRCFKAIHRVYKDSNYKTTRKTVVADVEAYGYRNHRVWRRVLLDEMRLMMKERSIPLHYESKFGGIVSDSEDDGVDFLINGSTHHASLLMGSDGIWSTVRNHIESGIVPEYTGLIGILSHIKTSSVDWPSEDFEPNATIQGKSSAIFYLPEDPDIDTIMIGTQINYPEQTRQQIEELQADKDQLVGFYQKGYEDWGATARSIVDSVVANKKDCYIWPFVKIPRLQKWFSPTGRVLVLGDAAHGLPPSSGQGINQALEDVFALALLLESFKDGKTEMNGANGHQSPDSDRLLKTLAFWQEMRQKRIDAVFDWTTNSNNANRMPEAERKKLIAEGKFKEGQGDDMSWLYRPRLEEDVREWLASQGT